ncbi:MAG: glutathione S-transferase family protein [Polyangiaceae bacterium]
MKLVIANKNYSSWSLRAWLLLREAGIPFEEEIVRFGDPRFAERIARHSPVGRVPVLVDGDLAVWDSLAIAEYVAEKFPEKKLWPEERAARARARSMCAEMHAGFSRLRSRMPMNCEASLPLGLLEVPVQREIDRMTAMWNDARATHGAGGPFLFGRFTIADAYFAPIVWRFVTYAIALSGEARVYVDTMTQLASMQEWLAAARAEKDFVPEDEPYRLQR